MPRIFILFLILLIRIAGIAQYQLVGIWKPTKSTYYNLQTKVSSVIYDKIRKDSIKQALILEHQLEYKKNPNPEINTTPTEFKKQINNLYKNYDSAKLILNKDSTYYLESYGLITPEAEPGWHFGNRLRGKWEQEMEGYFKLILGSPKPFFNFYYKIIKIEKYKLILGQVGEGIIDKKDYFEQPYLIIEFNKQ